MKAKIFLIFCFLVHVKTEDACPSNDVSCEQCIKNPLCSWKLIEASGSRCVATSKYEGRDTYNPDSSLDIIEKEPINDEHHISPQKVELKLRLRKPVYFNVTFKGTDIIQPPHFEDIIVDMTHDQPDQGVVRIEALKCPQDPAKYRQNYHLYSAQSNQNITLETEFFCSCPSD